MATVITSTRPADPAIRALSIRQPWAALILDGLKTVENRTWPTAWRGTLVIHTGTRPDPATTYVQQAQRVGLTPRGDRGTPLGAYLGAVELVNVHHHRDCPGWNPGCDPYWAERGLWHWVLHNPRWLADPLTGPGRLRLWSPPPAVARRVAEAGGHR